MASLYEIDQAILECVDCETGEIVDQEKLDGLMMERSAKIESVALWVKNLESDAVAYKAEKEAFAQREKQASDKAKRLKEWLARVCEGEKFSTAKCAVSFRTSESVAIAEGAIIPDAYMRTKTTSEPDKTVIKDALKTGVEIIGCQIVTKLNTNIK
jgi:hypothetical protein